MNNEISLTPDQIDEITKCALSPEYFVENFCWLQQKASAGVSERDSILPFGMGLTPDEPHFFQRKILNWLHDRENVLTLKSRRVGCSWIAAAYAAWMINFHKNVNILFISRSGAEAKKILAKVRFILKNLAYHDSDDLRKATRAPWLCGEITVDNKEQLSIGYRDDSGEVVMTSDVVSLNNTDDAARGDDATFIIFDELAFYEHPDETWSSAQKTLARGGHWMAISTPNGVGDTFHRMTEQGDLSVAGHIPEEELGFKYITIHWSEAGITQDQVNKSNIGSTDEKSKQEWEFHFISPGSAVFHPTHLVACYKPIDMYPEVALALAEYREEVAKMDGNLFYYSGADSIVGKKHKKAREKDFNAWVSLTKSGIQAFCHMGQEPLSKWAGMTVDGKSIPGMVPRLHANWPGMLQIEENGPGYTVLNRYEHPPDTFSSMSPVAMSAIMKRGAVERLILLIEAHEIVITDLRLYQQLQVFEQVDINKYAAPQGYNDDLVLALIIAVDSMQKHGSMAFPWGDNTDDLQKASITNMIGETNEVLYAGPKTDILTIPSEHLRSSASVFDDDLPSIGEELPFEHLIADLMEDVPRMTD